MITIKPEVIQAWHEMGAALQKAANEIAAAFMSLIKPARTTSENFQNTNIYKPLKLNLQFFSEDPNAKPDGFYPTLKDAFKANPHLQVEHKTAITNAVSDRFKSYDFDTDEAKAAIAEKRQREKDKAEGKDTESVELKNARERVSKLEARTKALALDAITGDPEQSKLISRLASDQIAGLKLTDDLSLDADAVKGIVAELSEEFPSLFPASEDPDGDDELDPPAGGAANPPAGSGVRGSGQSPKTNNPPAPKEADVNAVVAEMYENLKKTKRI